ncbi:MAG: hypothetical protein K2Y14_01200 [Burkholderiales bacterium]|nr:hypothetical protein [Burkholderiales bacterium]
MLVINKKTKELKLKISESVVHDLENLTEMAKTLGYDLDVSANVEKHLSREIIKVREQLNKNQNNGVSKHE